MGFYLNPPADGFQNALNTGLYVDKSILSRKNHCTLPNNFTDYTQFQLLPVLEMSYHILKIFISMLHSMWRVYQIFQHQ